VALAEFPDLLRRVVVSTGLTQPDAERLIADVLSYFDETVEQFVRRRHSELQRRDLRNAEIWQTLARELSARRFAAAALSERQLRRLVYG
jgi:hypothetical protein